MPASREQQEHAVSRAARVFGILKQAAERGEACPTNAVLGERFGVRPNTISSALSFLEANGMIEVECLNRNARVVTICATGRKTVDPTSPHHIERKAA